MLIHRYTYKISPKIIRDYQHLIAVTLTDPVFDIMGAALQKSFYEGQNLITTLSHQLRLLCHLPTLPVPSI